MAVVTARHFLLCCALWPAELVLITIGDSVGAERIDRRIHGKPVDLPPLEMRFFDDVAGIAPHSAAKTFGRRKDDPAVVPLTGFGHHD